jgi:hypothetical protein
MANINSLIPANSTELPMRQKRRILPNQTALHNLGREHIALHQRLARLAHQ